jgi:membrane-bound ClpP family serine protease
MNDSISSHSKPKKKAGLFDIRFVIAGLIGVYGVILVLLGIFNASDEELARGDGLNINLWAGLGMLVVAIAFGVWARVRPVVVPDDIE